MKFHFKGLNWGYLIYDFHKLIKYNDYLGLTCYVLPHKMKRQIVEINVNIICIEVNKSGVIMELLNRLKRYTKERPHQCAFRFDQDTLNYRELYDRVVQIKQRITHIPKQSYVGLTLSHPMDTMIYYLALLMHECVPCLLDHRWSREQQDQLIRHYGLSYLVDDTQRVQINKGVTNQFTSDIEGLLHIGFTSGTTGLPKAYYRNEHSWIISFEENEPLMSNPIETIVAPGPLSHSLSLYACVYALYSGRTFEGQHHFNAQRLLHNIEHAQQNVAMFLVPTMLAACTATNEELTQTHHIFSTGDKLHDHFRERVRHTFPNSVLIEFFGTSEASFISYNYDNQAPTHSVGKLFSNVEVKLSHQVEHHIGLLQVCSDMVFSGYVDSESMHSLDWIETGDYASVDSNGYLFLHGRKHDRMIIGGRNVFPQEIERIAMTYPEIEEVVVMGVPHQRFGEIACMLYTASETISKSTLRTYLSNRLARYQIPSKIIQVPRMNYTASGKIARSEMKSLYLNGSYKS